MQRLRGSDAFTVYSETPRSPFFTLKVAIYRPTAGNRLPDLGEMVSIIEQGIQRVGTARAGLRFVRVPLDLHHPVWVSAPAFSLKNHLHDFELPAPGSKEQFCEFLSELMGKPLDPRYPLWEIWVVSGLEGGRVAVVFKVHHAMADGRTMARLIELAHSTRQPRQYLADIPLEEEPIPGKMRLVGDAMVDLVKSFTVELPQLYRSVKQFRAQASAATAAREKNTVTPSRAPFTRLDVPADGRERVYRYERFSLSTLKSLAHHLDCTLNTLILGVCSEALKRYLQQVDTVPEASLITAIAIGQDKDQAPVLHPPNEIHNNYLAVAYVPLYQNIADFRERLQAIKAAADSTIANAREGSGKFFDSYLDFLSGPVVKAYMQFVTHRQKKGRNPFANLVISNVPGPRSTLYALDGRLEMEELLSVGNLVDGANLNITVWSYADNLSFSFFFRKHALQQPESLVSHVRDVVEEMLERYSDASAPEAVVRSEFHPAESGQMSQHRG